MFHFILLVLSSHKQLPFPPFLDFSFNSSPVIWSEKKLPLKGLLNKTLFCGKLWINYQRNNPTYCMTMFHAQA